MTLAIVIEGLHERFATVLDDPRNHDILDYTPTAAQKPITLFSELDSFQRGSDNKPSTGQVTAMRYRIAHRVLVRLQDASKAEDEIVPLVNSLCAAVDADPKLGGRLNGGSDNYLGGIARISDGEAAYLRVGGTEYRLLTLYSDVLEKFAYRSLGR